MTTRDKSMFLWLGGALVGGVAGYFMSKKPEIPVSGHPILGSVFGAIGGAVVVGGIGDEVIERRQRANAQTPHQLP